MKLDIVEKIEIPEGIEIDTAGSEVVVRCGGKKNAKKFNIRNVVIKKQGNCLVLESKKATKKEIKMIKTIKAHIKNMLCGMKENFIYELEAVYVHFPMNVSVEGGKIIIKNFLGEKKQRVCAILPEAKVTLNKNVIIVESHNKEIAGQMAANLEKATKIRNRDRRKFQDGIYITKKCGEKI